MDRNVKITVVCLSIVTSILLICLQPHVHPDVRKNQVNVRRESSHEFKDIWENFCLPEKPLDILILCIDILFLLATGLIIFRFIERPKLLAAAFGISFMSIHLVWYFIYRDGFVPLNALVSASIFILVIYHVYPVSLPVGDATPAFREVFIEQNADNTRHFIGQLLIIAIAVGVSALAFNFTYMSKMFQEGDQGRKALFLAQRSIVTIGLWNAMLFLFFLLPIMYGKINRLIDLAKE